MSDVSELERPMGIDEAADFTSLKKSYLYKLCSQGKIAHYQPGGKKIIFRRSDLEDYLYRNRRAAN
jgi:excisionase family DNA binding protein